MKPLYECHCCLRLICFNHLTEHVEIETQTKEKFYSLAKELQTKMDSIQLSIENRLSIIERETILIEREKIFIKQANHLLDGQIYPINQIEQILEEFNQFVEANRLSKKLMKIKLCVRFFPLEETIVKVEPSLLDRTNNPSAPQCFNESNEE